jgi:hypothetical protein
MALVVKPSLPEKVPDLLKNEEREKLDDFDGSSEREKL